MLLWLLYPWKIRKQAIAFYFLVFLCGSVVKCLGLLCSVLWIVVQTTKLKKTFLALVLEAAQPCHNSVTSVQAGQS